jgi:hypothetical protein
MAAEYGPECENRQGRLAAKAIPEPPSGGTARNSLSPLANRSRIIPTAASTGKDSQAARGIMRASQCDKKKCCVLTARGAAKLLAMVLVLGFGLDRRASADESTPRANTSRQARDEAIRAIPLQKLNGTARAQARDVLQNLTIYRRLPTKSIDCDPDLYAFLLRHPEVVVDMWRVMGITEMQLERVDGAHYRVSDGQGTTGQMEYLYTSPGMDVIYSEGTYEGPLYPRTVRGKCLILLRTKYLPEPDGRCTVVGQLDTFLAIENLGVEVLAKTFQPLIGKAADHNFVETANFVANVSQTAETNEAGMLRLARKLNGIEAPTREQFLRLLAAVPQKRAQAEVQSAAASQVVRSPSGRGQTQ